MQKLYKVKLSNPESQPQHNVNGFLGNVFNDGKVAFYTRGEAIKKASMFDGKIELVVPTFLVRDLKIGQIDGNNLIDGVTRLMDKYTAFRDTNLETNEKIYHADIFDDILENYVSNPKIIAQMTELAAVFASYDYVMVIND